MRYVLFCLVGLSSAVVRAESTPECVAATAGMTPGPAPVAPPRSTPLEALRERLGDRLRRVEERFGGRATQRLGGGRDGDVVLLARPDGTFVTVKIGREAGSLEREHRALVDIAEKLRERGVPLPFPEPGRYDAETNALASSAIGSHDLTGRRAYVAPRSLEQLLAMRPPLFGPGNEALVGIVERGLRDAVRRVHGAGWVHRDIKPANILITQDAEDRVHVWLVDFGIALPEREPPPGRALEGTPDYRAPDQERGQAAQPAHDWHSVDEVLTDLHRGTPRR